MEIHCRHFNGYKPCGLSETCNHKCPSLDIPRSRILLIQLEAIGSVLRTTSLLPAIQKKYPKSHITWLTMKPSHQLLQNLPQIDRILTTSSEDLERLKALRFDVVLNLDKSLLSGGIMKSLEIGELFGFRTDSRSGASLPANTAAGELWELGLSNKKKFFENLKPETQLMHEALELGSFKRDTYQVVLSDLEQRVADLRRSLWAPNGERIVGINTGCSSVISYKKLSIQMQRDLVQKISDWPGVRVVLLGGPEDSHRNKEIARDLKVIQSPTDRGLRDGLCSVQACDLVISGDSLGMHMAIGLKKFVVAWFGPTCAQEIDLYERGVKILSPVPCSPCWKRSCNKESMCYDQVSVEEILSAVKRGLHCVYSSSKQPLSEIYSSLSL